MLSLRDIRCLLFSAPPPSLLLMSSTAAMSVGVQDQGIRREKFHNQMKNRFELNLRLID